MITPAELASMRADFARSLTDTATILRRTSSQSATGAALKTFAPAGAAVACRPAPMSRNQKQLLADQQAAISAVTIHLPYGTDVRTTDRVQIGAATYEVVGVRTHGNYSVETAADAVALKS